MDKRLKNQVVTSTGGPNGALVSSLMSVLERFWRNDSLFQILMLYLTWCAEPKADGDFVSDICP